MKSLEEIVDKICGSEPTTVVSDNESESSESMYTFQFQVDGATYEIEAPVSLSKYEAFASGVMQAEPPLFLDSRSAWSG